jgi:hypothetical protein
VAAVKEAAAEKPLPAGKAKLYIGKGRTVVDDPALYPDRTTLTGGWAGGEVGLKAWAAANAPEELPAAPAPPAPKGAKPAKAGKGGIYIGRGLVIDDDPAKYADKETIGALTNVTGGFAGGERGVKAFAATGAVDLLPPGSRARQFSPLAFAAVVAAVGAGGGVLLNTGVVEVEELAASGVSPASVAAGASSALAGVDGGTKGLVLVGAGLLAAVAGVAGVRGAVKGAQARAASAATAVADGAKAAAFWVAVFVAAKFVIENS